MIAIFLFGLIAAAAAVPAPHIINGDVSSKGKWPYQVSLQRLRDSGKFGHTCGASLISKTWVLTAAHCIMLNENAEDYRVKLGMFSLSEDDFEQELTLKRLVMHPDFSLAVPGLPDDVALLELTEPANLTQNVQLVKLPSLDDGDFSDDKDCWMSGWGRNERESPNPSDLLREKNVPVLTNKYCTQLYDDLIDVLPVLPEHICVNDPGRADVHACHGDSGGPLSCRNKAGQFVVAGIASRTGPLDCDNYPSIYIRVSQFLDFIRQYVTDM